MLAPKNLNIFRNSNLYLLGFERYQDETTDWGCYDPSPLQKLVPGAAQTKLRTYCRPQP